jgi:hypothetical protein
MSIGDTKLAVVSINHRVLQVFIYLLECVTSTIDNSPFNRREPIFNRSKSQIDVVDAAVNVTENPKQYFL